MNGMTPEMEALKTRLKTTWNAGDYAHFAQPMEAATVEILERLAIPPGTEMLDIGCGAGQIAIPAARAGVRVTGLDLAPHQVEAARARASAEGLDARFDEGDAEMLPYEDASFDVVISLIGAMFAPRPDRVAAELVRVCRPGGRIVMANWTAEGFVGQLFKVIGKHVPPSPLMASPLLWGHEPTVQERFQDHVSDLKLTRYQFPFEYSLDPAGTTEFYRLYYGPINRAFASLDDGRQAALREDLEQLWAQANEATDGTTRYGGEYLEVVAVRA